MYQVELDIVKKLKQEYKEKLASPPNEHEIEKLSETFCEMYRLDAPKAYLEFLRKCDGFEFNGCIIYGSQNIVENQLDYEYITDEYIIFAEYDIGLFCIERCSGKYFEVDKSSAQKMRIFGTFEEMIKYVLRLSVEL